MDVTQALRDAENTLREFIGRTLLRSLGVDWIDKCGVSADRIARWKERKQAEGRRQESGVVEERLLYYADFYDIKTILKKNWSGELSAALGDWKTMEVFLTELERLRDPDAHRRELLPHQKALAIGISGEIRARIVRYRSKRDTTEDCFPRIESARDSLGNIWTTESIANRVETGMTLRPGDSVDFVITASDPEGGPLEYNMHTTSFQGEAWQSSNELKLNITESHIGKSCGIKLMIRSLRPYHASVDFDDEVWFGYKVLPRKE